MLCSAVTKCIIFLDPVAAQPQTFASTLEMNFTGQQSLMYKAMLTLNVHPGFQSRAIQSRTVFSNVLLISQPKTIECSALESCAKFSRTLCFGTLERSALECSNVLLRNARTFCFGNMRLMHRATVCETTPPSSNHTLIDRLKAPIPLDKSRLSHSSTHSTSLSIPMSHTSACHNSNDVRDHW